MKLREQFKTEFSINTSGESGRFADKCEKIADDFAIGFSDWYLKVSEKYDSYLKLQNESKELLEIYKKEKGL